MIITRLIIRVKLMKLSATTKNSNKASVQKFLKPKRNGPKISNKANLQKPPQSVIMINIKCQQLVSSQSSIHLGRLKHLWRRKLWLVIIKMLILSFCSRKVNLLIIISCRRCIGISRLIVHSWGLLLRSSLRI